MPIDIFDRFPKPACATLLGWHLMSADPETGRVRIGFEARPEFCNPAGFVQGGLLSAMLDDSMGPAVLVKSGGTLYSATIDLHVSFLAPAKVGTMYGEAVVVQMGKTIAFVESKLMDGASVVVAMATASMRLVPVEKLATRSIIGHQTGEIGGGGPASALSFLP